MLLAQLLFEEKKCLVKTFGVYFLAHLKYLSRESNYLLSVIFEEIEKLLERTQLSVVKDQPIGRVTCSQSGKRFQQDIFKFV